jgi:hypothetical protein
LTYADRQEVAKSLFSLLGRAAFFATPIKAGRLARAIRMPGNVLSSMANDRGAGSRPCRQPVLSERQKSAKLRATSGVFGGIPDYLVWESSG